MNNINSLAEKIQYKIEKTNPPIIHQHTESFQTNYGLSHVSSNDKEYKPVVIVTAAGITLASSIIINVLKLIRACKNNSYEATTVAHRPNLFQRRALKRAIHQEVGGDLDLRREYYNEILKQGTKITPSEMEGLYEDSGYATMEYKEGDSSPY